MIQKNHYLGTSSLISMSSVGSPYDRQYGGNSGKQYKIIKYYNILLYYNANYYLNLDDKNSFKRTRNR